MNKWMLIKFLPARINWWEKSKTFSSFTFEMLSKFLLARDLILAPLLIVRCWWALIIPHTDSSLLVMMDWKQAGHEFYSRDSGNLHRVNERVIYIYPQYNQTQSSLSHSIGSFWTWLFEYNASKLVEFWLTSRACRVRLIMDVWTNSFISTQFMAFFKRLPNEFSSAVLI